MWLHIHKWESYKRGGDFPIWVVSVTFVVISFGHSFLVIELSCWIIIMLNLKSCWTCFSISPRAFSCSCPLTDPETSSGWRFWGWKLSHYKVMLNLFQHLTESLRMCCTASLYLYLSAHRSWNEFRMTLWLESVNRIEEAVSLFLFCCFRCFANGQWLTANGVALLSGLTLQRYYFILY